MKSYQITVPKRHYEGCGIIRQRDMDTMNVVANADDSFMSDDSVLTPTTDKGDKDLSLGASEGMQLNRSPVIPMSGKPEQMSARKHHIGANTATQAKNPTHQNEIRMQAVSRLFNSLDIAGQGQVSQKEFLQVMDRAGFNKRNPIMKPTVARLKTMKPMLSMEDFMEAINTEHFHMIQKALTADVCIPDWDHFSDIFRGIYEEIKEAPHTGKNAAYIPQLAKVDPDLFAVSCCTIDGQMFNLGDCSFPFCAQSVSKPITYCMCLEENGETVTHQHVGREASGRNFNDLSLNQNGLPHNPMVNSGAIMCASLIGENMNDADKFDYVLDTWKELSGGRPCGFSNPVYLSERSTADRNFALAYMMREANAFKPGVDIQNTLELYFQLCSIEADSEQMAIMAATLANGGMCPLTNKQIFSANSVRCCLSLMVSCGMYDFSGEWAYKIGLPAKSGVSGAVMIVVPRVCGLCVFSPPLDKLGNSAKGIMVANAFIEKFNFHPFDAIVGASIDGQKEDPTRSKFEKTKNYGMQLLFAAAEGDIKEISHMLAIGVDINFVDYDKRGALHLAVEEGHTLAVQFLLSHGADKSLKDRWDETPTDAALKSNNLAMRELFQA